MWVGDGVGLAWDMRVEEGWRGPIIICLYFRPGWGVKREEGKTESVAIGDS